LKPGLVVTQGYRKNDTIQSGTHNFLLTLHSNHRPVSHRQKSPIFPTLVYLSPPLKRFPLELDISARSQKAQMTGYQMVEEVLR